MTVRHLEEPDVSIPDYLRRGRLSSSCHDWVHIAHDGARMTHHATLRGGASAGAARRTSLGRGRVRCLPKLGWGYAESTSESSGGDARIHPPHLPGGRAYRHICFFD